MFKKKHNSPNIDLLTEVKGTCTPSISWVNSLLMHMYRDSISDFSLSKSKGIPSIPLQDELPEGELSFDRIINRFKVLSGLDPITFAEAREGHIELVLGGTRYSAKTLFDDSADDPTYQINMSISPLLL